MVEDAHGCRASLGAFAGHLGLHLSLLERNAAEIRESLGSHPANVAVENVSEMLEVKHLANLADLAICDANSNEVAETVKWGLEHNQERKSQEPPNDCPTDSPRGGCQNVTTWHLGMYSLQLSGASIGREIPMQGTPNTSSPSISAPRLTSPPRFFCPLHPLPALSVA